MLLRGRGSLVTGAAQGQGRAIAVRLAQEGAAVVLLDVDADLLAEARDAVAAAGDGRVETVVGSVASRADVRAAVGCAIDRFGRLDAVIAQAAIFLRGGILDCDDESWQRQLDVNLTGTFYTMQESARAMGAGGSIVATASTNAFYVEASTASYSASKGGVWTLVRAAALDLAARGIRVNGICPGTIDTRMAAGLHADPAVMAGFLAKVPMGRLGRPEEIAATAAWLASDESSFMTGQCLTVDGGITIGVNTRSGQG